MRLKYTLAQAALMLRMTAPRLRKSHPDDSVAGEVSPDDAIAAGHKRDSDILHRSWAPPCVVRVQRGRHRLDDSNRLIVVDLAIISVNFVTVRETVVERVTV